MHDVCMSPDKRYRYWLEAKVSGGDGRVCMFLMLNPSTADAVKVRSDGEHVQAVREGLGIRDGASVQPVRFAVSISEDSKGQQ